MGFLKGLALWFWLEMALVFVIGGAIIWGFVTGGS